jgi:hypothetical protein
MRLLPQASWLFANLLLATSPALAQIAPPSTGAQPKTIAAKPVATVPIRPGIQAPADTANAMPQAERLALQSDLAWVGQYNGAITGDVSERMVNAIKDYQKLKGGKPTGVLNPQERAVLADTARRKQENVGWRIVTDMVTGARLGIPGRLAPQQASDGNGSKWTSPNGTVQIILARRKEANPTMAALADHEKKEPPGRAIDYTVVKPDFFVLSGLQGLKKFYIRGTFKGDEVRVLTILYDQATENTVEPVVIAMSSAFNAFPAQPASPPPRRTVDYGTGTVVSGDGAIVTDRDITDGCVAITIPGLGHADRIAEDREHGLALLRVYGARGLKPLALSGGGATSNVEVIGIADPQSQGGAAAVTGVKAQATTLGGAGDYALTPAPALGYSGAAAVTPDGKFAGLALLRQTMIAGAGATVASPQAVLVPVETVRAFVAGHGVTTDGNSSAASASTVRVICVRK